MIADWLTTLFDATGFLTRGHCGPWSESLIRIYIASNVLITLAYFIIPLCLCVVRSRRRHDIQGGRLLLLFAAFIAACGMTHACDIAVFMWPAYRFFTLISAVTAILSVCTALALPRLTDLLVNLPSSSEVEQVSAELAQAIADRDEASNESRATITALRRQVDHLERMRKTGLWVAEQETALRELKTLLDSSLVQEAPRCTA